MDLREQLLNFYHRYPLMREQDFVKLIFQSEFFGGHLIKNEMDAFLRLQNEAETCTKNLPFDKEPPNDDFLGMTRVNIRPFVKENKDLFLLNKIFAKSSQLANGTLEGLNQKLDVLLDLASVKKIDLSYFSLKRFIGEYRSKGYPLQSHSSAVKMNYFPAYRVVKKEYWQLFDAIFLINRFLSMRLNVVVAIEGNSGTGKSFFANALQKYYGCGVICADDFFLPAQMRTQERLATIGGNIHFERLAETLKKLKTFRDFDYLAFDCATQTYTQKTYTASPVNIVEGCYSLHPALKDFYDIAILVTADKATRQQRIFLRDGEETFQRYLQEWIPKEDEFLKTLSLYNIPTVTVDTSNDF